MAVKETSFTVSGLNIAAKIWNEGKGLPFLAIHGWLDNAASFDTLAPLLNQHIVAIDLPGHGHSGHKPANTLIHLVDAVVDMVDIVNHFGWQQFGLIGHSLGAAIASLVAGTIPHRISSTILVDGLGPFTTPSSQAPYQLRFFLEERMAKPNKSAPKYDSIEVALNARLKATPMQPESAQRLVERGLKPSEDGKWTWRTDPRLLMPSPMLLTEEQTLGFLNAIVCPVCIIRPEQGYPYPHETMQKRLQSVKQAHLFYLPGHHHVHLDDPVPVANIINTFLQENTVK